MFEIESKESINMETALKHIDNEIRKFLGELNYGKAGIMLIDYKGNKAILKVNHKHVDEAKTALALVKDINNHQASIRTLGTSGILKKAKQRYFSKKEE